MAESSIESLMDEHLTSVQCGAKAALERFRESGLKMDRKFMDYFLKLSTDR